MWEQIIKNITSNPKPYRVGAELFVWVIVFLFPAVFFRLDITNPIYLLDQLLQTLLFACIYYLATLLIIPTVFSGKILKFVVLFIAGGALFLFLQIGLDSFINQQYLQKGLPINYIIQADVASRQSIVFQNRMKLQQILPPGKANLRSSAVLIQRSWFNSIFIYCILFSFGLLTITFRKFLAQNKKIQLLEKEKVQAELDFLRSQISPHFIFNILNNICSLARKKSDQTEPALLHLSKLMRYSLYDTAKPQIPLEREVTYIQNYLQLQQLRYPDALIQLEVTDDLSEIFIQPMLLTPFVENAFKHGVNTREDSFVIIKLCLKEDHLYFEIKNNYHPERETNLPEDQASGIGIENVQKRLQHLYPDQHTLLVEKENSIFSVTLTIQLKLCFAVL